jgi:hypothetical protein
MTLKTILLGLLAGASFVATTNVATADAADIDHVLLISARRGALC